MAVIDTVAMTGPEKREGRKVGRDKYFISEIRDGITFLNLHEFRIFCIPIRFTTVTSIVNCIGGLLIPQGS